MKLKVRYENEYRTIELDDAATDELWVTFSLEGEDLTKTDKEKMIQEAWEERFNKPDYNNWHRFNRHNGCSKAQSGKDDDGDDVDTDEPLMCEVADNRIFRKDEIEWEQREEREAVVRWVWKILKRKPTWAEAFVAVRIDGVSVNDFAAFIGKDASTVSKWLARTEKKLRENYSDFWNGIL